MFLNVGLMYLLPLIFSTQAVNGLPLDNRCRTSKAQRRRLTTWSQPCPHPTQTKASLPHLDNYAQNYCRTMSPERKKTLLQPLCGPACAQHENQHSAIIPYRTDKIDEAATFLG